MRKWIAGLAVVAVLAGGIAAFILTRPSEAEPRPNHLTVTQIGMLPSAQAKRPLHAEITDPKVVGAIYDSLLSLPSPPTGPIACPADAGPTYRLLFLRGSAQVLRADAESAGCRFVRLSTGKTVWALSEGGTHFLALLRQALHFS